MTKLVIDLSDVAGESHPDDTVVVWSPVHREGIAGRTVSPTQHTIRLTEGVGEREVEPGPLMVQTHVRAIADTRPKEVVVPDQDSVTLWELLEQDFTYTPPVISVVSQDRAAAEDAADRAEAGADRVGTAEQVETWAANAKISEANANTAASDALTIKNSIPSTVQTEVDTRVPPKVAEAIADDRAVADAAAAAVVDAVDAAMPSKADTSYVDQQDQALGQRITDEKWFRRNLVSGENLNEVTAEGGYNSPTWSVSHSLVNRPTVGTVDRAKLNVYNMGAASGHVVFQEWSVMTTNTLPPTRAYRWRDASGVWSPWWEETNKKYVDDQIRTHTHPATSITGKSSWVGTGGAANAILGLDTDGIFNISTSAITGNGHPVNLQLLNQKIRELRDGVAWQQGRVTPENLGSIDNAPQGWVEVWSASHATGLGLPLALSGMVLTALFGQSGFQWQVGRVDSKAQIMMRTRSSGTWNQWGTFSEVTGISGAGGTSTPDRSTASGFKLVPLAVTLGGADGNTRPATGSYRVPVQWAAPITRWRLHVSTKNPRTETVGGTDVALDRVTFGEHAGSGDFITTPTTIAEGVTVPSTGEDVALPWQTTTLPQGVEHLIGFDYTSDAEVVALAGGSWSTTGTAGDTTADTARDWNTPLDWWVEAETYTTTPTIAVVGDSTSVGVGADFQVKDSWLSRYCRQVGALPVHYAASGASTFDYRNATTYLASRWQHLARPDAVIWALGANDFGNSTWSVDQVKARATESMELARSLISPNLYVGTAKPRNTDTDEQEAKVTEFNDWLLGLPPGVRDAFDFAAAIDDGRGDIPPEFDADGVHVNAAGYTAMIAQITRPVTTPPVVYAGT